MPLNNPLPGPNSVAEYLVSSVPWLTSSSVPSGVTQFAFPQVTSFVTVKNTSATSSSLLLAFTANGFKAGNYLTLAGGDSFSADFRVKCLFVSSSAPNTCSVIAGLTTIPQHLFPTLTGSVGNQGIG